VGLFQHRARCPVVVSKNFGVLQKFAVAQHIFKLAAINKMILAPVLFAATRGPCRVRDREIEIGDVFAQLVDQGRFPGTRRRRDDEANSAHSRFCTCSRHFSISAFICRPSSVMRSPSPAMPEVFASSVFASRFISCSRKSSCLPASPPLSSNLWKCS